MWQPASSRECFRVCRRRPRVDVLASRLIGCALLGSGHAVVATVVIGRVSDRVRVWLSPGTWIGAGSVMALGLW